MNPRGFDADVGVTDGDFVHPDRWVDIGPTDPNDGYTQNVQFELRGKRGVNLIFHECNDTTSCPSSYKFVLSFNGVRFQIWKDNSKKEDRQRPSRFRLQSGERFKSFIIRLYINVNIFKSQKKNLQISTSIWKSSAPANLRVY